jgi:hypothetical protein
MDDHEVQSDTLERHRTGWQPDLNRSANAGDPISYPQPLCEAGYHWVTHALTIDLDAGPGPLAV